MSVAAARCVGIGISGRLVGIEQIEIVEVDPLIGFVPRKRHNHVDEEPDPVAMAASTSAARSALEVEAAWPSGKPSSQSGVRYGPYRNPRCA